MGEAKVILSEIDNSQYVSGSGDVYAGIVVKSPKGDATKPTLVTNTSQLYSRYIGNKIPVGADIGLYSARKYLELGSNLWVRRYVTSSDSMGAAVFPSRVNESDGSVFSEYPKSGFFHSKEDVDSAIGDDNKGIAVYSANPGEWGKDIVVDLIVPAASTVNAKMTAVKKTVGASQVIEGWVLKKVSGGSSESEEGTVVDYSSNQWSYVEPASDSEDGTIEKMALVPVTLSLFRGETKESVESAVWSVKEEGSSSTYETAVSDAYIKMVTEDSNSSYEFYLDSKGTQRLWPVGDSTDNFFVSISPRSGETTDIDNAYVLRVKDVVGNVLESWTVSNSRSAFDGYGNSIFIENVLGGSFYIGAIVLGDSDSDIEMPSSTIRGVRLIKSRGSISVGVEDVGYKQSALNDFSNTETYPLKVLLDGGDSTTAYKKKLIEVAKTRRDCVAVLSTLAQDENSSDPLGAVVNFRKNVLNANSSYATMFTPHVKIYDEDTASYVFISPDAYYAGLLSQTKNNSEIWYPVAGLTRGVLDSALDVSVRFTDGERDLLVDNQINPIRFYSGAGVTIWGNETLQTTASKLQSLHVRMLLCQIEPAIKDSLKSFLFELNDEASWDSMRVAVDSYLDDIVARRGLDSKRVVCDRTNNSANDLDNNRANIDIYIVPTGYLKEIHLNVTIQSNSIAITEA